MAGNSILLKPYLLPVFSFELLYFGLHHGLEHLPISCAINCSGCAVLVAEVKPNGAVMSDPAPDGDLLRVSLCHTVRMWMLLGPDAAVLLIHEATKMEVSLIRHDEPVAVCRPCALELAQKCPGVRKPPFAVIVLQFLNQLNLICLKL